MVLALGSSDFGPFPSIVAGNFGVLASASVAEPLDTCWSSAGDRSIFCTCPADTALIPSDEADCAEPVPACVTLPVSKAASALGWASPFVASVPGSALSAEEAASARFADVASE